MGWEDTRTPPHSDEAEFAVLGSLLIDNRAFDHVADVLHGEEFYIPANRAIYSTIARLVMAGKPADVVTVYEAGGHDLAELNDLAVCVPTSANARRYAQIVAEHWLRRELQRVAFDLVEDVQKAGEGAAPVGQLADQAASKLLALCGGRNLQREPMPIDEACTLFIDQLNDMADGKILTILTGLTDLDEATGGGGRPGELWVIGARPSMGKSALMLSLSLYVSLQRGVLVLTQEDSVVMWVSRAVANLGRVNLADLRNPQRAKDPNSMWARVADGVDQLPSRRLLLDDQGGLGLADVRRKTMQAKRKLEGGLHLVIVDYLQLMQGDGDNRNQMLGHIANGLKALAKEMDVWIVLLSQLSRKADEISGPPHIQHLRDSGDIEGAADTIGMLYREAMRKPTDANKRWAQLSLVKQKNGPISVINLDFDGANQRFSDWEGPPPVAHSARGGKAGSGGLD